MSSKPKPRRCDRCGIQEGSRSRSALVPETLEPTPSGVGSLTYLLCSQCRTSLAALKPVAHGGAR